MINVFNTQQLLYNPERAPYIKPFTNKYNWEGINYLPKLDDCKRFDKNILTIGLNILYTKEKEILPVYTSKHNSSREKQIILLLIPNEKGWNYLLKNYLDYYIISIFIA